jgi:hypothetical protein
VLAAFKLSALHHELHWPRLRDLGTPALPCLALLYQAWLASRTLVSALRRQEGPAAHQLLTGVPNRCYKRISSRRLHLFLVLLSFFTHTSSRKKDNRVPNLEARVSASIPQHYCFIILLLALHRFCISSISLLLDIFLSFSLCFCHLTAFISSASGAGTYCLPACSFPQLHFISGSTCLVSYLQTCCARHLAFAPSSRSSTRSSLRANYRVNTICCYQLGHLGLSFSFRSKQNGC